MLLKIVENDDFRDIIIHEGESFLLPGMAGLDFFISLCFMILKAL
jgi:hypothetical protein